VSDGVCRFVTVHHRHLHVHKNNVWSWPIGALWLAEIIECFLSVPHSIDREFELLNRFQGDLLVDWVVCAMTISILLRSS
jgi:hypothetical protein